MNLDLGDIVIDGKPFRIDPKSYRVKDVIDFSPRATVPGNSSLMSDLSMYQPLVQTDWQHGFGFHWYSDDAGYMATVGNIDTRHDGLTMLFTKSEVSNAYAQPKYGMVTFNGAVYSWGDGGLDKFDGAVWTSVYSTGKVNYAMNAGDYLIFCPDGARIKKMATDGTITDAGLDANSTDYRWTIIHNGYIYAGKDGSNIVHFDSNADLSQLEGTTADPDKISCGIGNMPTLGAVVFAGNLYVSRQDGLWQIGEDRVARRVLDYTDSISPNNFRSMAVVNGYLMFSIRDRVVQWNGSRVADITPSRITDEYPYVTYGEFKNFNSVDNFLFCTGRTNETVYTEAYLVFDGVGWHNPTDLISDGLNSVTMLSYEATNNRLWYHINETTSFIQFQSNSAYPYANFPTTGQHSLITSRMDMGFRQVTKSMQGLFVEAYNLSDDIYIDVYFSIDGRDYLYWDRVKRDGVTELTYPGGDPTVEFYYTILRFDFVTNDSTQSPILESYTMRFLMRPIVRMGYSFLVMAGTNSSSETYEDERSSREIVHQLREIRNSKKPVSFTGLMGEEITGYLTSIGESAIYRTNVPDGDVSYVEYVIQCSFVDMSDAD